MMKREQKAKSYITPRICSIQISTANLLANSQKGTENWKEEQGNQNWHDQGQDDPN